MNQDNNQFNRNNFNTYGNNGIPNNQPLNNQTNIKQSITQTNNVNVRQITDDNNYKKKSTLKKILLYGLIGKRKYSFIAGLGIIILIIVLLAFKGNRLINGELLFGEWDCGSNIKVLINKNKSFEMYDNSNKNNLDIIGNFIIDDKVQDGMTLKYTLTLKTNNRTVSGEKLTNDYTTQYEISMDGTKQKELVMINTVSYSVYSCTKVN